MSSIYFYTCMKHAVIQIHPLLANIPSSTPSLTSSHPTFRLTYFSFRKWETMWRKKKLSYTHCWWECKWEQPLWRTVWRSFTDAKNRTAIWYSNFPSGYICKRNEVSVTEIRVCQCLLRHYSEQLECGKSLKLTHWWVDKWTIAFMRNEILHKEKWENSLEAN